MSCRFCAQPLEHSFCDLGTLPLANAYLAPAELEHKTATFPVHVYHCQTCGLVQLQEHLAPEKLFSNYAYRSSYSDTWRHHVEAYAKQVLQRFELSLNAQVIEIGSNDGYLLQFFASCGIATLGVEPAANIACQSAVPTLNRFFTAQLASELPKADLLIGNNVLAHVPDINDFIKGLKLALKQTGVISLEFPHLLQLVRKKQFDTIYHEHVFYFSLTALQKIFAKHGLAIFDVEELSTHGGSLRVYGKHAQNKSLAASSAVKKIVAQEAKLDLRNFAVHVAANKLKIKALLMHLKRMGKSIVGYGAPAKATILLNYCAIGPDLIEYTVDKNPDKQGRYISGCRIPIKEPATIFETRPDYVFIFPWNLKDEIIAQLQAVRTWGGQFIVPIPDIEVIP